MPKRTTSGGKREGKRKPQQKPAFPSLFPLYGFPLWTLLSLTPISHPLPVFCFVPDTQAKAGYRTGSLIVWGVGCVAGARNMPIQPITEKSRRQPSPAACGICIYSAISCLVYALHCACEEGQACCVVHYHIYEGTVQIYVITLFRICNDRF